MDLDLPAEDHPARVALRAWLARHPRPSGHELAEGGWVAPHWPPPWGRDADPVAQLAIDDELARAGVSRPVNPIGIGWAGPTLVRAGTPAQRERWLPALLAGTELWCQLFSEPEAGSDLATLATRAERDGDEWVVRGAKVWTSLAHVATWGILLARTDPEMPKHAGISYFVCPMRAPGVTVSPIVDMTGAHAFNEVVLDQVRLPADHLVGAPGQGWDLARVTLGNERVSLSGSGALWGRGPAAADLLDRARRSAAATGTRPGPVPRQGLAALWAEAEALRLIRLRTVTASTKGRAPGPEASVRKALADDHGQRVMGLAKDLAGAAGMLAGEAADPPGARPGDGWPAGFLFAPALTIGGGTAEVQRNIIAERVLGLPRDPEADPGRSWAETQRRHRAPE